MPSPSYHPAASPRADAPLPQLLDAAFGFFMWAAHFLIVYIAAAVACALGLGTTSPSARSALLSVLALFTVAAAAIVLLHAAIRYRRQRALPELRFRMAVTLGCDAIASLAIAWQLFPILMVPLCR